MSEYRIEGGFPIQGTITVSGNKNAALPCIAATLLTSEPVTLHNIPDIADTAVMLEILKALGASVKSAGKIRGQFTPKTYATAIFPSSFRKKYVHPYCLPALFWRAAARFV